MDSQSDELEAEQVSLPGGSFRLLVQKLGYQALMSLGVVENPLTREQNINLSQARMVIEDLRMLAQKTRGNLDEEEAEHLQSILAELSLKLQELS